MSVHVVKCEHFGDALERIRRDHVPNRWVYRGQTYRREVHRITEENQVFELENLYPQSFRFAANYTSVTEGFSDQYEKEYRKAEALYYAFNSFIISKYESDRRNNSARFAWMDPYAEELKDLFKGAGPSFFSGFREKGFSLKDPTFNRLSWSLAQHYGVVTALLDLTFDPDVAGWFASNSWQPHAGPERLEGSGIIYRFEVQRLTAEILLYNFWIESASSGANIYKAPMDKAFIQDLRRIPSVFALRPNRQEAAVVLGFDALKFARLVNDAGEIAAFVFPHLEGQLSHWPPKYAREFIQPLSDPFFDLQKEFDLKWRPLAETVYGVKFTKPVVILTDHGMSFANISDEAAYKEREAERTQLYESGMALLGKELSAAESKFRDVIKRTKPDEPDKLSSLAYVRIAAILLLRSDFIGSAQALNRSLDGPDRDPRGEWVGQLLQTTAQGAQALRNKGKGELALPVLERVVEIARRAGPEDLTFEAELSAMVLVAAIQLERGDTQSGLNLLEVVTKNNIARLTGPQRFWVATAFHALAQAYEALGNTVRADEYYEHILSKFASDAYPATTQIVHRVRAAVDRNN